MTETFERNQLTTFRLFVCSYQADVLVGTAARDLSLSNNPCARALRKEAGEGFQRECTSKSPVAVGDIAVLDQTGKLSCQAVMFAVCSDWDNGKGKKVIYTLTLIA